MALVSEAHVRERPGAEATAVAFLESARFYTLRKDNRRYAKILKHLKDAMAGAPLREGPARVTGQRRHRGHSP